jgi:hypothetical protein
MPSKSGKQARFMAMIAHDPKAASRTGVPQSVGKDFNQADKAAPFSKKGKGKDNPITKGKAAKKKKKNPSALRRH